jgi:transcriptional regulator with XRE-family HTH domain
MTSDELRAVLAKLGLSQADFARLIGVTPRAVALWVAGDRAISGAAEAYARLLSASPASTMQIEIQRLKKKENEMRDGLYSIEYQSSSDAGVGMGYGVLILDTGRAFGADPFGGKYDGEYVFDDEAGLAELRLKLTFPPNSPAVFGITNPYEWSIDVKARIDPRLDSGETRVETPVGPHIDVRYRYLRPLPDF